MRQSHGFPAALLVLVLGLVGWAPGLAQTDAGCSVEIPGDAWTRVDTEHFRIQGGVETEILQDLAVDLERLREILVQLAPSIERQDGRPVLFHVFPGIAAMNPYRPEDLPVLDPGFLLPTDEGAYGAIGAERDLRVARKTAYRQFLHHLLLSESRRLPLWLRYGLAEFYQQFEVLDGKVHIGRFVGNGSLRNLTLADEWLPLPEILNQIRLPADGGRSYGSVPLGVPVNQRDLFVAELRALTHYLLVGQPEERRRKMPLLVRTLVDGADAETAFRDVYGLTLEALDAELNEYIRRKEFFHLSREAEPWTGQVETRELARHEVLTDLGWLRLQARPSEPVEAEAYFHCALSLQEAHGPAWRGLGRVAELQGDEEIALTQYRKALELRPEDSRTLERLGRLLLGSVARRPATDEEIQRVEEARAAFLQSLEIEPRRAETWADLGRASLLLRDTRQEAVDELTRAAELLPDRPDVVSNLLLAHAQVGDRDEVETLYERLLEMDAEPETLARAQEVRYQLDFQLADAWVKSDRSDDAVALYAQILTGTRNPQLATQAAKRLELMARAERYNQFVELYQEASGLLDSSDPNARAEAAPVVEALEALARPGLQLRAVRALRERLEGEAP